jgi:hypothetical protein
LFSLILIYILMQLKDDEDDEKLDSDDESMNILFNKSYLVIRINFNSF